MICADVDDGKKAGAWPHLTDLNGLKCPRCGCPHLFVLNTRRSREQIIRYRMCRYCGKRIVTYEKAEEVPQG